MSPAGVTLLAVLAALAADPAANGYPQALASGWEALQAERFDAAAERYRHAAELRPSSEDAWVGLQRAQLGRKAWRAAAEAGARALALNPDNLWAHRFQGLARYQLGDYADARTHYERVLAADPDDAEMQLGLGFTLVQLGDEDRGHALCARAAAALPDDPRVAECARLRDPARVTGGADASATVLASPGDLGTLYALSAAAHVRWVSGFTLAAGATLSRMGRDGTDWDQVAPVLRLGVTQPAWDLWAGGAVVVATDSDTAGVVLAGGAWRGDVMSVGLRGAVSLYPGLTAVQVNPTLGVRLHDRVTLTLGGELIGVDGPGTRVVDIQTGGRGPGPGGVTTTSEVAAGAPDELLGSGRLALAVRLHERVTLTGHGWYGARRFPVDALGLSIWSAPDRFTAGWGAGLTWRASDLLTLSLTYSHQLGDQIDGEPGDLELIGGTLGAAFSF